MNYTKYLDEQRGLLSIKSNWDNPNFYKVIPILWQCFQIILQEKGFSPMNLFGPLIHILIVSVPKMLQIQLISSNHSFLTYSAITLSPPPTFCPVYQMS